MASLATCPKTSCRKEQPLCLQRNKGRQASSPRQWFQKKRVSSSATEPGVNSQSQRPATRSGPDQSLQCVQEKTKSLDLVLYSADGPNRISFLFSGSPNFRRIVCLSPGVKMEVSIPLGTTSTLLLFNRGFPLPFGPTTDW